MQTTTGSPPHVREGHPLQSQISKILRITPARAGRTLIADIATKERRDHPRSRGKDFFSRGIINMWIGSPPLAREGRGISLQYSIIARITPARAGRTLGSYMLQVLFWDHPRSRGKDDYFCPESLSSIGSPPLAREGLLLLLL